MNLKVSAQSSEQDVTHTNALSPELREVLHMLNAIEHNKDKISKR